MTFLPFPSVPLFAMESAVASLRAPASYQLVYREECTRCFDNQVCIILSSSSANWTLIECVTGRGTRDRSLLDVLQRILSPRLRQRPRRTPFLPNRSSDRPQYQTNPQTHHSYQTSQSSSLSRCSTTAHRLIFKDSNEPPIKKLAIREEPSEQEQYTFSTTPIFYTHDSTQRIPQSEKVTSPRISNRISILTPASSQLDGIIAAVMNSLSSAQKSEVKAWEEEILSCVHTRECVQVDPKALEPAGAFLPQLSHHLTETKGMQDSLAALTKVVDSPRIYGYV